MFLDESLNNQKFKNNKKLNLLKNKLITPGQFLSLIEPSDPYMVIGPAIVDKQKSQEFIKNWKSNIKNVVPVEQNKNISNDEIIQNFSIIYKNFNQTLDVIKQFNEKLSSSSCKPCVKNRYLLLIAEIIKNKFNDGRQYDIKQKKLFEKIIHKFFPYDNIEGRIPIDVYNHYDNVWINPDSLVNIGYDLIDGLTNCFQCTKKHLSRAKVFYDELNLGYPHHIQLLFNQFVQANKDVEQAFVLYWDSIGQLDMAACQLVGQVVDLPHSFKQEIIQLANKIRTARINFQENIDNVPNWDSLRIDVQRLQNKINKYNKDKNQVSK